MEELTLFTAGRSIKGNNSAVEQWANCCEKLTRRSLKAQNSLISWKKYIIVYKKWCWKIMQIENNSKIKHYINSNYSNISTVLHNCLLPVKEQICMQQPHLPLANHLLFPTYVTIDYQCFMLQYCKNFLYSLMNLSTFSLNS